MLQQIWIITVKVILTFLGSMLNFLRPIANLFDFGFALKHDTKFLQSAEVPQAAKFWQKVAALIFICELNLPQLT